MPVVPGFDYDVFVSYAHADNVSVDAARRVAGWVTILARRLNDIPGSLQKHIFIDHQLQPGDPFDQDLRRKIRQSALLLIVLSQNYVDSQWCGTELDHFITARSDDPLAPANVFVVEIVPFEDLLNVPATVQQIRKQLIHAKFWYQPDGAASFRLAGYPSPDNAESAEAYGNASIELRNAVDRRLLSLRKALTAGTSIGGDQERPVPAARRPSPSVEAAMRPLPVTEPSDQPTVLLADVTSDLSRPRQELKAFLEYEGIEILPAGDYAGRTLAEFDEVFGAHLRRSTLFVQLLSRSAGVSVRDLPRPLPQLQFERAQRARIPIIQWAREVVDPEGVSDDGHVALFGAGYLSTTNFEGFKDEVLRKVRRSAHVATSLEHAGSALEPRARVVFLDDVVGAEGDRHRVREVLRSEGCQLRSLPQNTSLGENGVELAILRRCRAGVTIYTDRSSRATALHRLYYFLNQIASQGLDCERWAVYFGPLVPSADLVSEFGIDSDDVVAISGDAALVEFVRSIAP